MRIICPNCDAQYEVPDEVIPPEGRDVQCSNCGTTWMQEHPDQTSDERSTQDDASDTDEAERAYPSQPDAADGESEPDPEDPGPRRRELDPVVAGILREEAQREAQARARDSEPEKLEMQPDLGLSEGEDAASRRDREARERRTRLRDAAREDSPGGLPDDTAATAAESPENDDAAADVSTSDKAASRKAPLPDVEEIKSSLLATDDRNAVDGGTDTAARSEAPRRRGFGRGFVFAVAVFAIAALAYRFAPDIARAIPQTDPWISGYVTWVDDLRFAADEQVRNLLTWLDGLTASGT